MVILDPSYDLARMVKLHEDTLRNLTTQRVLQNASASQSDGSTGFQIQESTSGGTSTTWFYGPGDHFVASYFPSPAGTWPQMITVGQVVGGGGAFNSSQMAVTRQDGTQAVQMGGYGVPLTATDPWNNPVVQVADFNGGGLVRPWIHQPTPLDVRTANWPAPTTSGAWVNISNSNGYQQSQTVNYSFQWYCAAGYYGQFQFYWNGYPMGTLVSANGGASGAYGTVVDSFTVGLAGFGSASLAPTAVPAANQFHYGALASLQLYANFGGGGSGGTGGLGGYFCAQMLYVTG